MNAVPLLFAQQAADNTGRTIRLIIMGLLAVAMLLALLTVWYWRHTDPRRRLRPVADPVGVQEQSYAHEAPGPDAGSPVAGPSAGSGSFAATISETEADEWLRLTGPQALPRTQTNSTHNPAAGLP